MPSIETFKSDIEKWVLEFVSVYNESLGNAPCPFARGAILGKSVEYTLADSRDSIVEIAKDISKNGLIKPIIIIGIEPDKISASRLYSICGHINKFYLRPSGIIALPDHPSDPELIKGVRMNQGEWSLLIIQSIEELNKGRSILEKTPYYENWTSEQIKEMYEYS